MFPENFQHILRVMNTNIEGQRKIMYALCSIKGCGRRYANLCCKKAEIDLAKRAGELVCCCKWEELMLVVVVVVAVVAVCGVLG